MKTYEVITKDGKHQRKYEIWQKYDGQLLFYGVCFTESPEAYMKLYNWNPEDWVFKPQPFSMWEIGDSKRVKSE